MAINIELPSAVELRRAEQVKLPTLTQASKVFEYFPIESVEEEYLRWTQKDNFVGLQNVRGIGGKPPRISMVGDKTYLAQPGYYGEFVALDEVQLTRRRDAASLSGKPLMVSDMVGEAQDLLLHRRIERIKYILWTLLTTGTFSVSADDGTVMHTASFSPMTFSASVAWSTRATATPLNDMFNMLIKYRGQSVRMDSSAELLVNAKWVNHARNNTNSADLGGKRINGGNTPLSLEDMNQIFVDNGLPRIVQCEEGYLDSSGTWQLFIPDGVGVMVAKRTNGAAIGSYRQTLNMATKDRVIGAYTAVIPKEDEIPFSIEVHDGHNGGPTLTYPGTIVVASL